MKKLKSTFSDLQRMIHVKIDGRLKGIKKFELKSSTPTIYIRREDDEENLEVYKCPPTSINYKLTKRLFATDIFIPADLECGNEKLIIGKHQLEKPISESHTNTLLNRVIFSCNWTSINLGERKSTKFLWLPDGKNQPG